MGTNHMMNTTTNSTKQTLTQLEADLAVPTTLDFEGVAEMKSLAFSEKWWGGPQRAAAEIHAMMFKIPQTKLSHSRVYKDETGRVLGGIQLQLYGDEGDTGFPESFRHVPRR